MDIYSAKYYVGDAGVIKIEGENKNYNGERKTEENYIKMGEGFKMQWASPTAAGEK